MKPIKRKNAAFIAACLFPSIILLLVFVIYPTISIFNVSLFKWGGYSKTKTFVGLENYKILFTDRRFFDSLKNSLLLIVVVSAVTLVLALFCAEVLTRERLRARTFFRIVLYGWISFHAAVFRDGLTQREAVQHGGYITRF